MNQKNYPPRPLTLPALQAVTYCQCGECESSRRGAIETKHRPYRPPEPPKWLTPSEGTDLG